jgi:hypothetical protein
MITHTPEQALQFTGQFKPPQKIQIMEEILNLMKEYEERNQIALKFDMNSNGQGTIWNDDSGEILNDFDSIPELITILKS